MGQISAGEVAAELVLDESWHGGSVAPEIHLGEERLEVFADDHVQHGGARMPRLVGRDGGRWRGGRHAPRRIQGWCQTWDALFRAFRGQKWRNRRQRHGGRRRGWSLARTPSRGPPHPPHRSTRAPSLCHGCGIGIGCTPMVCIQVCVRRLPSPTSSSSGRTVLPNGSG